MSHGGAVPPAEPEKAKQPVKDALELWLPIRLELIEDEGLEGERGSGDGRQTCGGVEGKWLAIGRERKILRRKENPERLFTRTL